MTARGCRWVWRRDDRVNLTFGYSHEDRVGLALTLPSPAFTKISEGIIQAVQGGEREFEGEYIAVRLDTEGRRGETERTLRVREILPASLNDMLEMTGEWVVANSDLAGPLSFCPANYQEMLTRLYRHGEGALNHNGDGLCPDPVEGAQTRDPDCPVCQALVAMKVAEAGL